MIFEIVLIIAVVLVLYFCFSSLGLRFRLNGTEMIAELAYTLIRFSVDFNRKTGKVYFLGIRLKEYKLQSVIAQIRKSKPKPQQPEKKKPIKKRSILSTPAFKYLKEIRYLVARIRIKHLGIKISGGFSDPFHTGQTYAAYTVLHGIFPSLMSHINFKPDFSAENLKFRGKGLVSIKMIYILNMVLRILTIEIRQKIQEKLFVAKKGTSYG